MWQIENFLPVAVDECKMLYNTENNNNDLMIHLLVYFPTLVVAFMSVVKP